MDRHVSEKARSLIFPKLMCGFDHATILSPSFHCLHKECQWHNDPICVQNTTKIKSQIMSLAAYASETDNRVERVVNHHFASCAFVLDFRKWSEQVIKAVVKHLDLPQQGTGSTYTDLSL